MKKKDEQQIELEKKEQGFSIYVNGANVELGREYSRAKSRTSSRHTKTAGGWINILISFKCREILTSVWFMTIWLRFYFTCSFFKIVVLVIKIVSTHTHKSQMFESTRNTKKCPKF